MSTFGISPFGTEGGAFGGPGLISVLGVLAAGSNAILVSFDATPYHLGSLSRKSAVNPANYTLSAVDPTYSSSTTSYVPAGEVVPTRYPRVFAAEVDDTFPQQVLLYTEAKMEPFVRYDLEVSPRLRGEDCENFSGDTAWTFRAPLLAKSVPLERVWEERYRDFAFEGSISGSRAYRFDDNNDIALQNADESLRKRIYRRVFSNKGDFVWLPSYGADLGLKKLAKLGLFQDLANKVRDQILLEPDVVDAAVQTSILRRADGAFIDIRAAVRRSDDRRVSLRIVEPLSS